MHPDHVHPKTRGNRSGSLILDPNGTDFTLFEIRAISFRSVEIMKKLILISSLLLSFAVLVAAQKSNDAIVKQLKSLKADKAITVNYDAASNATKIMVIGDNFASGESKAAGIQAMNFGMAYFYPGQELKASPETINFTFWVLSKKPQFAAANAWTVDLPDAKLDLGNSRYASKPRENMEYLNFKLTRDDLKKITGGGSKFHLGTSVFTFTDLQLSTLKALIAISEPM